MLTFKAKLVPLTLDLASSWAAGYPRECALADGAVRCEPLSVNCQPVDTHSAVDNAVVDTRLMLFKITAFYVGAAPFALPDQLTNEKFEQEQNEIRFERPCLGVDGRHSPAIDVCVKNRETIVTARV